MPQLYNDNVGEVLRKYSADSSVTVGPNESNVSATGVQQIVAGNGINLDPAGGQGVVTVSANLDSALGTYTGNLQAGNITSLGNVTANFYLGNGFYLTGISAANIIGGYSNANVANYLQVLTSNVTTTANVSAAFLLGNGAFITGLPEAYSNANVANYLPIYQGNISAGNITVTNNVAANFITATFDVTAQNIYVSEDIQANNYYGGNITVTETVGANNIVATEDVSSNTMFAATLLTVGGNLIGGDADFGGNVTVGTDVIATGNVSGAYVFGNGAFLTGLPEAYSNANVANYLPTYTGNLQAGNILVINSVVIQGNLEVQGNTTYINSNVVNIDDKDIVIANGAVTASQANGAGLIVGQGNLANIIFNNPANAWTLYPGIETTGNVSAQFVLGNGRFLTGLPEAYSNANVANYLPTYTGNLQAGNATILGNISANVVKFNTGAGQTVTTGEMSWNSAEQTVDLGLNTDVTLQMGQEFLYRVKANGAINNGQIVMFSGVQGDQIVARVANTADPGFNSTYVIGMATQDIADTASGFVTSEGKVRDVNTGTFVVGDVLWLAPNTAGLMSNTKPAAGNARVQVAAVLKTSPGNGGIYSVRVTREPALADLENVADSAVTNDFLVYNGNIWNSVPLDISLDTTPTLGGNLAGGNYSVTTTGNVTAGYFVGNGSQLTGILAANIIGGYSNANVANYLQVLTSNVTTTANVQANSFIGNGLALTGLGRGNVYSLQYKDDDGNLNGVVGVTTVPNTSTVQFAEYTSVNNVTNGSLPATPGDGLNSGGYSGVAYGNGRYVAVAAYGTSSNIAINSTNGTSWSYGNLPANVGSLNGIVNIIYAANNFVVGTRSNTIYTSTDGTTWNTITANANVNSIQYANGTYSAVLSTDPNGNLAYSTNLTNWSNVVTTWSGDVLSRATGNGIFALSTRANVGGNWLTNVFTSTDAITFTASPENPVFSQPANVPGFTQGGQMAYNGTVWILFKPALPNQNDDDEVAVSITNFATLQQFPKPALAGQNVKLTAGAGTFLAAGGLPTDQVITSSDGINWSEFVAPYSSGWGDIAYGNEFVGVTRYVNNYAVFGPVGGANLLVPVNNMYITGGNSAGQVLTLANATTGAVVWSNSSGSSYSNANVANYLQVLSSNVTTTANIQANYFIGNGSQLTDITIPLSPAVLDFTFSGETSNGAVTDEIVSYAFSSDYSQGNGNVSGTTWTRYTTGTGEKAAASDTGVFITDGEYSINGGTTWSTLGVSWGGGTTYGLAFGNVSGTPTWVRVASGGLIYYNNNANGIPTGTWTAATESATGLLYAAAYGNGVFIAAGDDASAWYSTNGITWSASGTDPSAVRGLLWDGTRWLAIGNGGLFYSTDNGGNWTRVGTLTFGAFPGGISYNNVTNGIYRISGGSASTIYWCNGDPTVSGNWVTQTAVANLSVQNGQMQFIGNTWFASGAGIWRTSDTNANVWIADTTTGRVGTLTGYAKGPNAVIFTSTSEVERIPFNAQGVYNIGLPADPTYGANTITFTPSSGANANVAAVELGNLIVANRPAYTASYANSRVTVIDTNSGGDITGAFTVAAVSLPAAGTITLSVSDGANSVQDVITFTDPVTSATFQYSPAFNSNISNIVTDIGTTETLPDWLGSVFDSDTVRFTSNIPGFIPFNSLLDASITNGLSNGVVTTLAVSRTIDSYGYSGATVPGGNDTELQFNDNGSFGGTNGIYYNATTSLLSLPAVIERVFTTYTPMTGNIDYDVQNQGILYYNVNATANANINFRGYSALTLDNTLLVDDSITVKLWNQNGATAYLPVNYTIDGSNITPVWLNGAAPTAANANSTMQYTYTIVKTAANTYTVLASQQRFA